jgi:Kyanoviridae DNA helicase
MIKCHYYNESYCKIETTEVINLELYSYLKCPIPDFHLIRMNNPKYKFHDGQKRFYQKGYHKLHNGHIKWLLEFCNKFGYKLDLDSRLLPSKKVVGKQSILTFIKGLHYPFELEKHQIMSIYNAINYKKMVIQVPTSGGKTAISYALIQWFLTNEKGKILFIVPTKGLIKQGYLDFKEYGYKDEIYCIQGGVEKQFKEKLTISTWQSIFKESKKFFKDIKMVIVDEVHGINNSIDGTKALQKIMDNCENAKYRYGTTGTLKDEEVHIKLLEGIIGPIYNAITTKELMEKNIISGLNIKAKKLIYPDSMTIRVNKLNWHEQLEFLDHPNNPRQEYIINLALNLKGNTLILFRSIEHGTFLYEELVKKSTKKEILYIDGSISGEDRELYRQKMETHKNLILVASFGTTSTGISINNLHNIIFSASSKSKIRTLQSIGRGLRKHIGKFKCVLYDIVDNIGFFKEHYKERLNHYDKEEFDVEEEEIKM